MRCCTRYGNVMCSRGSVIPIFIDQIKAGKPLTITNPDMTRFLMSLDEAVDLVLFAFEHGHTGDLFIQKAPASTIGDLARGVQELFGDTGKRCNHLNCRRRTHRSLTRRKISLSSS